VLYADACSGIPGALHERTFAQVNAVLRRLAPQPEFILFPGDEIIGLTADPAALRAQWRHFLDIELSWLDRAATPIFHTTANHTTYDPMSEAIFAETLALPRNGPPGQEGLSYWVRRGDLLMVFVHTLWSGLGGEGHVETEWLDATLAAHADARHKLVLGHHPAHPVNGFSGPYARDLAPDCAARFWDTLVRHGVLAYLCSHILAFDVQVHRGVLQLTTAGAGTAHRMPEGIEYLHFVQAALDAHGLRYQVLDTEGTARERLAWPPPWPGTGWRRLPPGLHPAPLLGRLGAGEVLALRLEGQGTPNLAAPQTLLAAFTPGQLAPFWLGLAGPEQHLMAVIGPQPGRSPHVWHGPPVRGPFALDLLLHAGMGPGGLLLRQDGAWTSLANASPWGLERLDWPDTWSVGHAQHGPADRPFRGANLYVSTALQNDDAT
jgi:hypothetical protein